MVHVTYEFWFKCMKEPLTAEMGHTTEIVSAIFFWNKGDEGANEVAGPPKMTSSESEVWSRWPETNDQATWVAVQDCPQL